MESFIIIFKQRVIDCFLQEWQESINNSSILVEFKHFKRTFTYEYYLDSVPFELRFYITKLRLSAHSLKIQAGRYGPNRIPRNERYCTFCDLHDVEDFYHFVLICPLYAPLRVKYFDKKFYFRHGLI